MELVPEFLGLEVTGDEEELVTVAPTLHLDFGRAGGALGPFLHFTTPALVVGGGREVGGAAVEEIIIFERRAAGRPPVLILILHLVLEAEWGLDRGCHLVLLITDVNVLLTVTRLGKLLRLRPAGGVGGVGRTVEPIVVLVVVVIVVVRPTIVQLV
jgi:hypothetical protein